MLVECQKGKNKVDSAALQRMFPLNQVVFF